MDQDKQANKSHNTNVFVSHDVSATRYVNNMLHVGCVVLATIKHVIIFTLALESYTTHRTEI